MEYALYHSKAPGVMPRQLYKRYLEAWQRAGYPDHMTIDNQGQRVWTKESMKQNLEDRAHPRLAELRRRRGELIYQRKMSELNKF